MTLAAFRLDYKVPLLSPELAAYTTTIIEIICPVLLAIGLASRLAAIPMLIITGVIQFTYMHFYEHVYWAILLGMIIARGPGVLSIDYLISRTR
jgi:putative oxidoreductase